MLLSDRLSDTALSRAVTDFETDGVACVRQIFTPDEMKTLCEVCTQADAAPAPTLETCEDILVDGVRRRFYIDQGLVRFSAFERFVLASPAAELAGRLMRARSIRYFTDQLIVKEAGTRKETPWHQDMPYWPVEGRQMCSIWVPVDAVPRSAGMTFAAGSHRWQAYSPRDFTTGAEFGPRYMPVMQDPESVGATIIGFEMQPGDCLVFHAMTAHAAPCNATAWRRRAFSVRCAGEDVRHRCRPAATQERTVGRPENDGQLLEPGEFPVIWNSKG
ncbi:MAG: phytanoyl-CoA dioxygenase family protein [Paracoccaceae bacterium]|nr:phytanoyl-CoA dioxygenase family protein [Paracoccaceae bacterium]